MYVLSPKAPIPTEADLASHFGYVYRITNRLTSRVYIGQHEHDREGKGEGWRDYLGSGVGHADEVAYFGADHFDKHLLGWGSSRGELVVKEKAAIALLVASGHPHANIDHAALFAVTEDQRLAIEAYRFCHTQYDVLEGFISLTKQLKKNAPAGFDTGPYDFQVEAFRQAYRIRKEHVRLKKALA